VLIVQPSIIALAPGATVTVRVLCPTALPGALILATSNSPAVQILGGADGLAPGPIAFTLRATPSAIGTALISFTVENDPADSGTFLPVAIIPVIAQVPMGYSAAQAIAMVRRRTNLQFGEPSDADILATLNDGLEQAVKTTEPILATASLPIVNPNTNLIAFPTDVDYLRDVNYSTSNPALGGTIVYEMVRLEYNEFIQETDSSPAGGIGGIPVLYSLIADQYGAQLMQFYPFANSGYINLHYYKRPTLWQLTDTGQPASYTDLDPGWQVAAILYSCSLSCEGREDYQTGAPYYMKLYTAKIEEMGTTVRKRRRSHGVVTVRDVSVNESTTPVWIR